LRHSVGCWTPCFRSWHQMVSTRWWCDCQQLRGLYHQDLADSWRWALEKSRWTGVRFGGSSTSCWTHRLASDRTQHPSQWRSVICNHICNVSSGNEDTPTVTHPIAVGLVITRPTAIGCVTINLLSYPTSLWIYQLVNWLAKIKLG